MPIYFIRHGESEANERNQLAGRQDSPLTQLGIEQAKQAGRVIAHKGLIFDEIHVSPLQRAHFTAQKIAEISKNTAATMHISDALQERHFGFLQGRNKSLWKKVLGYQQYNAMFHSYHGVLHDGETWDEMYQRVLDYYKQVLLPASKNDRTILVVAHKYIIEMFALIVAGLEPRDYCDFKVPNSHPSSEEDLRYLATHVPHSVNTIGELIEIHLPLLMLSSAILGLLMKLIIGWSLPYNTFTVGVILCLSVSTFFELLSANPSRLSRFASALKGIRIGLFIRMSLGIVLLFFGPGTLLPILGTFFLLPPATLVPSLALLWGGDYALALRITLSLSVFSFLLLGASAVLSGNIAPFFTWNMHIFPPIRLTALLILAAALILPALVAQWYRFGQPIQAGTLNTNWGWIGGMASLPLAFLATYYYTSVSLIKQIMNPEGVMLLGITLLLMVGAFGVLYLMGRLVKIHDLENENGRAQNISATTPNIFLWSTMIVPQLHNLTVVWEMMIMWTLLIFFAGLFIQEQWLVRRLRKTTESHSVRISFSDVTEAHNRILVHK